MKKENKIKPVKSVLFHQVSLKSEIIINGKKYIKFSPRNVMDNDGKIISIPDATQVKLAS